MTSFRITFMKSKQLRNFQIIKMSSFAIERQYQHHAIRFPNRFGITDKQHITIKAADREVFEVKKF